jgi:hypothetical protein
MKYSNINSIFYILMAMLLMPTLFFGCMEAPQDNQLIEAEKKQISEGVGQNAHALPPAPHPDNYHRGFTGPFASDSSLFQVRTTGRLANQYCTEVRCYNFPNFIAFKYLSLYGYVPRHLAYNGLTSEGIPDFCKFTTSVRTYNICAYAPAFSYFFSIY